MKIHYGQNPVKPVVPPFKEGDIVEHVSTGCLWLLGAETKKPHGSHFDHMCLRRNAGGVKEMEWHKQGAFYPHEYRLYTGTIILSN